MYTILSSTCMVCNGMLEETLQFPYLPLTGSFSDATDPEYKVFDQALMVCNVCGHAQLKFLISPQQLYGSTYGFRTSLSATARGGSEYFNDFITRLLPTIKFNAIVEFGCNDGYLLNLLKDKANRLIGIDPVAENIIENGIEYIKGTVEKIDIQSLLGTSPELILSQHTLEHLEDPKKCIASLLEIAYEETIIILEFPCFDQLLQCNRFDHIFHQHLHYFSLNSIFRLLKDCNAEVLGFDIHHIYWGSLLIAFKKAKSGNKLPEGGRKNSPAEIRKGYELFKTQMSFAAKSAEKLAEDSLYGFGAALMLPVLAYHMNTDFSYLKAVLDDDPKKSGKTYSNLPVKVESPQFIDFKNVNILLTALDNRRPIIKRLADLKPRTILTPLQIL